MSERIIAQHSLSRLVSGFLVLIIFLFSSNSYSQEFSKLDSVATGKTYKIILFDETEIIGKVVKQDSLNIYVLNENMLKTIKKDDIFNISRNLAPSKYNFLIFAGGGISFLVGEKNYFSLRKYSPQFGLQASGIYPFSDSKGLRVELSFSKFKRKYNEPYSYYNYSSYEGGGLSFYSVKGDFIYGLLRPPSNFLLYGSVGLGLHISHEEEYSHTYSYDSTQQTYWYPSEDFVYAVFSIGGGFGYRFTKNFGIYADVQFDVVTAYGFFIFGSGYFPLRAGIFYAF